MIPSPAALVRRTSQTRSRRPAVVARTLFAVLLILTPLLGGPSCQPNRITILAPATGLVDSCGLRVQFALAGGFDLDTLEASLNFHPLAVSGSGPVYTIWVDPGFPLQAENQLLVRADRLSDGMTMTSGRAFTYLPPKARARLISDPGDLIQGPLAQGRVGDYLLENGCARFIVQKGLQRDFNQVGAFGGNLIDAEIVVDGIRQGNDNFWEIQPAVNIETVINATSVVVLNDGADGNPAVVESCGPDDLLDGINASTEVVGAGGSPLPPEVDDADYDVEGCTAYTLERGVRRLQLTTTLTNMEGADLPLYPGDYVSGAGELEQWTPLADALPFLTKGGVGELLANWGADALSYFGFDEAEGVSYAVVAPQLPGMSAPSSTFTTTGVSYLLHGQSIPAVLQGAASNFIVPAGDAKSFTRWFTVGDGSGGDAVDAQVDLLGASAGSLRVCVTVANAGQDFLAGARVAAARDNMGGTSGANVLRGHWVTGADGCSEGRLPAGNYLVAAAKEGFPYQGGASAPVTTLVNVPDGGIAELSIALPETGLLRVLVEDEIGPTPARVGVVGFDPSPEPLLLATLLSLNDLKSSLFADATTDPIPDGFSRTEFAGKDDTLGVVEFDLEPGDYQVAVSRGNEYSLYTELVTINPGETKLVEAQIVRVLETPGFISSDYHVHLIDSPDSRISSRNRVLSMAGEGVENIIATDHSVITDLNPTIAGLGLEAFVHSTPGEEITTFDTGHYNAYPQGLDPSSPQTRGSTDWAGAAPPGEDFPSFGNYILSPVEIEALALLDPQNAGLETVVQINHIDSHFSPLKIDTSLVPPASVLAAGDADAMRLDPGIPDFFHPFQALEVWNGMTINHQKEFLDERIGIWMNLLNQGLVATAITDTDTHSFHDLRSGGGRTWTPSSSDDPAGILDAEIGLAVKAGKAVGGQGIFVLTRLVAESTGETTGFGLGDQMIVVNTPGGGVDLRPGVRTTDAAVHLDIEIQAPAWAPYDTIEVYTNSETTVAKMNGGVPVLFGAVPDLTLTLGGGDFTVDAVDLSPDPLNPIPGAIRLETTKRITFSGASGLTSDTWVVVLVKGTEDASAPMFPVHASGLSLGANPDLASLVDVTPIEAGIRALGFANPLFVDMDGNPGFDPPIGPAVP
jgi:hypothetical protein